MILHYAFIFKKVFLFCRVMRIYYYIYFIQVHSNHSKIVFLFSFFHSDSRVKLNVYVLILFFSSYTYNLISIIIFQTIITRIINNNKQILSTDDSTLH